MTALPCSVDENAAERLGAVKASDCHPIASHTISSDQVGSSGKFRILIVNDWAHDEGAVGGERPVLRAQANASRGCL